MDNDKLKEAILAFVRLIKANAMGAQIIGHFPITDLKKGTKNNRSLAYTKFFNEEKGAWNVSKITRYVNVTFQRNYANSVNNRADNDTPYEVEAPKGKAWVEGAEGILLYSLADPSKLYLRISENANTKRETTYYVGNNVASEEEIAIIKEFSPKKTTLAKSKLSMA